MKHMKHMRSGTRLLHMALAAWVAVALVSTGSMGASAGVPHSTSGPSLRAAGDTTDATDDMVTPEQMRPVAPGAGTSADEIAPDFPVKGYRQQAHTIDVAVVAPAGSTGSTTFISDTAIRALVAGTGAFWKEQSNNQVSALTQSTAIKRYPSALTCANVIGVWHQAAVAFGQADASAYLSTQGRHLLVLVPDGCGQLGVGSYSYSVSAAHGGTIWASVSGADDLSVVAHEFGHNLGLDHSNDHVCPAPSMSEGVFDAATDTWSDGCGDQEYGDIFDLMGGGFSFNGVFNARPTALNVTHKTLLDALDVGEVQTVALQAGQTTVTVPAVLNSTGSSVGLRALKVTDPVTGQIYFVDFRGGGGYDSGSLYESRAARSSGLSIGVRVLTQRTDGTSVVLRSPDPYAVDGSKLYLNPGESLSTRSEGITVTVLGITGTTASIRVTLASSVPRLDGADRFAASAAISAASFTPGVATAYIANGFNFPDALSGAPVAAREGAPILLVPPDGIPSSIRTELERLRPARIVVLGGVNSVSEGVKTQLVALTTGAVTRLAGVDRFSASADISAQNFPVRVGTAYVASGVNFPDALSGAPVAAKNGAPILLVPPGSIPASIRNELGRLQPGRIVVLGGVNSVSEAVKAELATLTAGGVTRVAGTDRFSASATMSAENFSAGVGTVYIASGLTFPDALSGAPVAGRDGSPILLVTPTSIPASVQAELNRLNPARIIVLGGLNSVSAAVGRQLLAFIN